MKRRARIGVAVLLIVVAVPLLFYAWIRHQWRRVPQQVIAGELFRSGQPDRELLEKVRADGVRSVINLRGPNEHHGWYRAERRAAADLGLPLYDVRLQTQDAPPRTEVQQLVALLDGAEKPVLLHCRDGVDRTGWAAAVALALRGAPLQVAMEQMSRRQGHWCERERCHFHRFFAEYEAWLGREKRQHDAAAFRKFIDGYAPSVYDARLQPLVRLPESAAPRQRMEIAVRVTNGSPHRWATREGKERIKLGARAIGPYPAARNDALAILRTHDGPQRDLARANIGPDLGPGQSAEATISFEVPSEPGLYYVQLDCVKEYVHWFSDLGRPGVVFPLSVR